MSSRRVLHPLKVDKLSGKWEEIESRRRNVSLEVATEGSTRPLLAAWQAWSRCPSPDRLLPETSTFLMHTNGIRPSPLRRLQVGSEVLESPRNPIIVSANREESGAVIPKERSSSTSDRWMGYTVSGARGQSLEKMVEIQIAMAFEACTCRPARWRRKC